MNFVEPHSGIFILGIISYEEQEYLTRFYELLVKGRIYNLINVQRIIMINDTSVMIVERDLSDEDC